MGHKSEDAMTAFMQDILRIAHDLKEATALFGSPSSTSARTDSSPVTIDPVTLPSPPPLLPVLLEAGVDSAIASAASQIYQQRAEQLRLHIQESITATCCTTVEFPAQTSVLPPGLFVKKVTSVFTNIYLNRLKEWQGEMLQRIKQATEIPTKADPKNSRSFNHEYVPLLEHFFKENPFPTHADKMFLAQKSNMQYRQIHVWFQNRRNRTKKEGKPLRKKPTYEGTTHSSNKSYERMMVDSEYQPAEASEVASSNRVIEKQVAQSDVSKDTFVSSPPPHAFPSAYPPTCPYDPFPCKISAIHLSKPQWRRLPDGRKPLPLSISIDDLVERFSHLNVRGETRSRGSPRLQSHAATVAITVIPSRAPHPASMVRKYNPPTQTIHQYPSVRAPVSRLKAFQSPHPASKPLTLVPLSIPPTKNELLVKRKTMPLPQRFPGRRNTSRNTTPSESSSTSPSSPPLFSMDSDSRSCCSSSVSSSSTPPDIGSVQELPSLFGSPCCSAVDSPIYLGGCGAVDAIPPLSIL